MVSPLLLIPCLTIPVLVFFFLQNIRIWKNSPRPPGPKGLPIIGNLHQLDSSILFKQLWQLSKKYGPLFSLQLGLRPAIVVSSPKLAKEVLKNHDPQCCSRPKLLGQQKMSYNGLDISFSPHNEFWRQIKKTCVIHIFSPKCVSSFSSIRHHEVKQMLKKIHEHASSSAVTNLNELLISLSSSMICRIAFGRSSEDKGSERSRLYGLIHESEAMLGEFFFSDYIPFLSWIDKINGMHARLERIFKEMDQLYQEIIEEHLDPNRQNTEEQDIVDVLLQLKKQRSFPIDLTYDHIKGVFMDILLGATDTTAVTAVWAMVALMKNPRVMKKVQEEIRNFGVKKDFLDEHDIEKFSYFKAMIKEIMRLYPPVPLLIPRETKERCIIDGYEIPAKTIVYVNAWAIHRDPEAWKDPEEFYPERFLDNDVNFQGKYFELIPFGAGRRICPGLHMGVAALELILANLLYLFDWELPQGLVKEDIDTEVSPGIAQHKKNPLYLLAKSQM